MKYRFARTPAWLSLDLHGGSEGEISGNKAVGPPKGRISGILTQEIVEKGK